MKTLTAKPRYKIEVERIDDESQLQMWNLDRFAAEFNHPPLARIYPIFVVLIDGEMSAYFHAVPQVCCYPALHPDHFTARSFFEAARVVVSASKMNYGNPLWLIDSESPMDRPELLKKVHLLKTSLRVYQTPD